jgi:hypothetical protein
MKRRTFITTLGAASASRVIVAAEPAPTLRTVSTDVLVIGAGDIRGAPLRRRRAGHPQGRARQLLRARRTGDYDWPLSTFLPGLLKEFDLPACYRALDVRWLRKVGPSSLSPRT